MTHMNGAIPIIGKKKRGQSCVPLLENVLKSAKAGAVHSVALIIVERPGEYRVTGAGDDVDGLYAGCVELFKQLDKLVTMAEPGEMVRAMMDGKKFDA